VASMARAKAGGRRISMEEFKLKSELLLQSFWGGYMCKNGCLSQCNGYFNADNGDFGRGFIEYCVSRIFNIHRVPGYEQYYLKDGSWMQMCHEYGNLKESDINNACSELEQLYYFIQNELKKSKYVEDGKIQLVRSLRTHEIDFVTPQLCDSSNQKIKLPVNIINSYAHDGRHLGYGSKMSIARNIEVEKIIMFDECLYHPENVCANHIHGGEYEVWVIEENIFGYIELNRTCFIYEELNTNIRERFYNSRSYGINTSLYTDEKGIKRPCEHNKFTKWLIERNKREIEALYEINDEV